MYNALAAAAAAFELGVGEADCAGGGAGPGFDAGPRMGADPLRGRARRIFLDYAHNARSLANALGTLRGLAKGRLIVLFGCGGNRSRQRRFEMGETAGRMADETVITSDNPREEKPEDILADIVGGHEADRRDVHSHTGPEGSDPLRAGPQRERRRGPDRGKGTRDISGNTGSALSHGRQGDHTWRAPGEKRTGKDAGEKDLRRYHY